MPSVSPTPQTALDKAAEEAQKEIVLAAYDAFQNAPAKLGYGTENLIEGTDYPLTRLTQNYMLLNSLYRGSGLLRRIVNKPVEDAVSHWYKANSQITPEQINMLERLERRAKIKRNIEKGLKWGRLYGGAAGLIMIEGQGDRLDEPLDLDTIGPDSFKGIYIVDRWSGVYPSLDIVDDISDSAFGEPEYYWVRAQETGAADMRVHHSRILRFTGDELPYWEKQVEIYWGASTIETVFDSLRRYDNTLSNIAQLLFQANIWVQKSEDVSQLLSLTPGPARARIMQSLHAQQALMSSFNTRMIDKDDDLTAQSYSFDGLDKVFEVFQYDMSSVTGIPITILFGRSSDGLNATGDGDLENYYTFLENIQENKLRPIIEQILPIMCMSEFGAIPDDLDLTFNPVRVPSEKEKADIAGSKVNAITSAYTAGIIGQKIALKELKAMGDSTGMFINITNEDIDNADDMPDIGDMPLPGNIGNEEASNETNNLGGGESAEANAGTPKTNISANPFKNL
jgi:phage-related protein (TIGR01555 family)